MLLAGKLGLIVATSLLKAMPAIFFFHFMFIFERERDRAPAGEGKRKRETQNPKQAPGSELSAQSPKWRLNPRTEIMT